MTPSPVRAKLSERLNKLANDIGFAAAPGEARFHQAALLRAMVDAEVSALEARLAAAEGLEKRMRVRCDNADDHWLLLKKSADELSTILKGEGK